MHFKLVDCDKETARKTFYLYIVIQYSSHFCRLCSLNKFRAQALWSYSKVLGFCKGRRPIFIPRLWNVKDLSWPLYFHRDSELLSGRETQQFNVQCKADKVSITRVAYHSERLGTPATDAEWPLASQSGLSPATDGCEGIFSIRTKFEGCMTTCQCVKTWDENI